MRSRGTPEAVQGCERFHAGVHEALPAAAAATTEGWEEGHKACEVLGPELDDLSCNTYAQDLMPLVCSCSLK